jgi:hypothetical protein
VRTLLLWITLMLLPLLTGCGGNYSSNGHAFNPYPKKSSSASTQNPVQVGLQPPSQFQACQGPTIFTDDPGFQSAFQGAVLCPGLQPGSTNRSNVVRFKVGAAVPANTALCIVPFVYDADAKETCFLMNGQADVQLSTNQYTSLVVVPQAYLNVYLSFLVTPGSNPPSRLLFSL